MVPRYDFAKFWEKLHEIEKILGRRGGGGPKSATDLEHKNKIMLRPSVEDPAGGGWGGDVLRM